MYPCHATDGQVLVFFKSVPGVVTPDNMDSVILVSSMLSHSPASALYHSLVKARWFAFESGRFFLSFLKLVALLCFKPLTTMDSVLDVPCQ